MEGPTKGVSNRMNDPYPDRYHSYLTVSAVGCYRSALMLLSSSLAVDNIPFFLWSFLRLFRYAPSLTYHSLLVRSLRSLPYRSCRERSPEGNEGRNEPDDERTGEVNREQDEDDHKPRKLRQVVRILGLEVRLNGHEI